MSSYLISNAAVQTGGRFEALARSYDEPSTRALAATGVASGWRCWEVGGGGGSLATWLAWRVGATGSVLVTDIDTQWMRGLGGHPNVELRQHDVVCDPLPDGQFDLIHARLVLLHLPARHEVLDRLVSRLRPGGWLVVEDFDCERTPVVAAPSREDRELFESVHRTFLGLLRDRGADTTWGRLLPAALDEHGLRQVTATTHAVTWRGGSREIELHRVNVEQLADQLLARGVDSGRLADFLALLDDPGFAVRSYPLVSAVGMKP